MTGLLWLLAPFAAVIAVALVLIATDRPLADLRGDGLGFQGVAGAEYSDLPKPSLRAGQMVRVYDSATGPLVVMLHGSGWQGMQFHALARALASTGQGRVLVPDLRGHGMRPERRGDIDHIGQFEDDIAALIGAEAKPGQEVILLGHSSGGGLVLRFVGSQQGGLVNRAVLLSPFLHHRAPTNLPSSNWARPLVRRIIGLSILNTFRIRALNGLTAVQFRFPAQVLDGPYGGTATRAYSYRLMTGFAPAKYQRDIAALPRFLLIAGAADEAFDAAGYEPLFTRLTDKGRYLTLPGVGHIGVVDAPQTLAAIKQFLSEPRL